jgi:hypothetical protein
MTYSTPPQKDPRLWELARKRAGFKSHLGTYLVIITFLWVIWYFTTDQTDRDGLPWPAWPTIGWGIGILFHYLSAYAYRGTGSVEREYEKLEREQKNKS